MNELWVNPDASIKTKREVAIHRIQMFVPTEGYYLAMSYGKDSTVVYNLAKESGVLFDAHYSEALDPPELKQWGRETFPDVAWEHYPDFNFFVTMSKKGFPLRQGRWCCEYMKEWGGGGRMVLTGLRRAESPRRSSFQLLEPRKKTRLMKEPKTLVNPIIDWTDSDVWDYLRSRNLPYSPLYDEGASGAYKGDGIFRRLGCVLCPMETVWQKNIDLVRWPKLAEAWLRSFERYYETKSTTANKSKIKYLHDDAAKMFWWYVNEPKRIAKEQLRLLLEVKNE